MSDSVSKAILAKSSLPPTRWYEGLAQYQQQGIAHVLATVVAVNGSAPRALQAKMVVTLNSLCDTLGGGGLEHDVVMTARQLLKGEIDRDQAKKSTSRSKKFISVDSDNTKVSDNSDTDFSDTDVKSAKAIRRNNVYTKHYPLGAKLAQCCGGSVTVMFECFNITPPLSILVFGAGHVAAALMTVLAELPCQVDWVDSRPEMFERYLTNEPVVENQSPSYQLPAHIRVHIDEDPVDFVRPFIEPFIHQAQQRFILVMTHDHSLDFELVRAALDTCIAIDVNNTDQISIAMPYIGCIGSATKAKRFKDRLLQRGYSESLVDELTMPIGLPIGGKEPMAVAVSITAQILQHYHQD